MSFIDNPIIASLGTQLGLGPMFAAAGSPPVEKPAQSKPNIPEYKNRPYIPRNETGTPGGVGSGSQGGNPIMPGPMSQDTLQSPQVQSLLGQYGVTPSSAPPDPNLFIHNPAAFQDHPLAAGLLEHGLRGLAYGHEGSNFLQSLMGGVRGIQESNAASGAQVNSQLMAPIQQAGLIQDLQNKAQKASDEHNTAQADAHYKQGMLDVANQNADTKGMKANRMPDRPLANGQIQRWNPDLNGGGGGYEIDPDQLNQELWQKNRYYQGAAEQIANDNHGGDVSLLSPDEIAGIHSKWETMQSIAHGAASIDNAHTHADATRDAAKARQGGVGGKMSDQQKRQYADLDNQDKDIQKLIDGKGSDMSKPFVDDETGKLIVSGSARADWIKRQQFKQSDIRSRKQSLLGGGSSAPTPITVPTGADGAWDPLQKKVIYKTSK